MPENHASYTKTDSWEYFMPISTITKQVHVDGI